MDFKAEDFHTAGRRTIYLVCAVAILFIINGLIP